MRYQFGSYVVDDALRELRAGDRLIELEPKVFDLLALLLRNRDRVVDKHELLSSIWAGQIVSDSALSVAINAVRRAVGDDGTRQQMIRTYPRRGFRFVYEVMESASGHAGTRPGGSTTATLLPTPPLQKIHYCKTADGVSIAYTEIGRGEPLIRLPTMYGHLGYDWENPLRAPLLHALRNVCTQIRYDGRGTGLSDREAADISFDGFMADLDAVVRASGIKRYALLGISGGAPIAIAHAAKNPQSVSKLILHGAYAVGRNRSGSAAHTELAKSDEAVLRHGWGDEHSAYLRAYSARFMPRATPEQIKLIAEQQRSSTSAEMAVRLRRAWDDLDVRNLLPKVMAQTLVLHCRADGVVPYGEAQTLASVIPKARMITIESENHIPFHTEPAWPQFVGAITGLLAGK